MQKALHIGGNLFALAHHIGSPQIVLEHLKRTNQESECCQPEELQKGYKLIHSQIMVMMMRRRRRRRMAMIVVLVVMSTMMVVT